MPRLMVVIATFAEYAGVTIAKLLFATSLQEVIK
jgi:hypothetical protein